MTPESTDTGTRNLLLDPEFMGRVEQLTLVSRKIFRGRMRGERRSPRRGQSVEFADFRNYVPGDDLRRIDWNVYGRLEKMFLKLFLEEEDLHVHVLVDTSASMNFGAHDKLEYAKRCAAALAYIALCNQDRVVVNGFDTSMDDRMTPVRGKKMAWRVMQYVAGLEAGGGTDLAASCRDFVIRHRGRGVVIVVSDFLDRSRWEPAMRMLIGRNLDIFALHVMAREEIDPDLRGDLRLVDSEVGDETDVSISRSVLKSYERVLGQFLGDLRQWCTRRGINYLFTTTDTPFDQLILGYLRQAGLVR